MRDTLRLRTTIALLVCVPGPGLGLAACSPPPKPQQVEEEDETTRKRREAMERRRTEREETPEVGERRKQYYEDKARREGKPVEDVTPPAQLEAQELDERRKQAAERRAAAPEPATPDPSTPTPGPNPGPNPGPSAAATPPSPDPHTMGLMAFPGDPPFIDGYNPEEESCISGNWCGAAAAAAAVAVPGLPEELGCATRITGGTSVETIKGAPKTYAGLSAAPNMQGALNQHGTELARAKPGGGDTCCYHWFEYCSGRPHLGEHGPVLAALHEGTDWARGSEPDASASPRLPAALRERIAEQWRQDARAEHASVAAFARATLELMAVGAPPALLAEAQRAGLDEIDHAQRCLALAARYGGAPMQPGPLPALAPRPATLARLAADTFAEGCVGETIAALAAQRAARGCTEAEVARHLEPIADDEARHAALAWSTIAWALREGGEAVASELRRAAAALRPVPERPEPTAEPDANTLAAHGRLDARALHRTARDAWDDVIGPMLDEHLAALGHA
ncbi:ferritin-like domain-containing protein [Paraliomyxa miuraensis]|uniref:ferritin-like domain-containing protein n=1 Tax=Paraliomyxa miuraensis TaxID=376150 RepID=UPI002257F7D1|nr:ferritin-like domain-containing protein [Paraliomyxa miuraensis]MCX4239782.1 ferritin-like domain-containing protein [Paraliomyxa miuraensis]